MCKTNVPFSELPPISKAEWTVMRVIWSLGPSSANEVVTGLDGMNDWKPKTIHTLLRRLTGKKVLEIDRGGREMIYRALVKEGDCQLAESISFLGRVFGRESLMPLVAAFVEREQISGPDLLALRKLLDREDGK